MGSRLAVPSPPVGASEPSPSTTDLESRWRGYLRTADRVFWGCLAVTALISAVLVFFVLTGSDGGPVFRASQLSWISVVTITVGFVIFNVLWGWLWYGVKLLLLRRLAGFSRQEARETFSSRMNRPFDLAAVLRAHPERRIRIADMVGRRGRFVTLGMLGFWYVYSEVARDPKPGLLIGLQNSLFDMLVVMWMSLLLYRSDGWLARVVLGPQARIMDGTLGRANVLLPQTLWGVFRFVMVPLSVQLGRVFPPDTYAVVYALIWISYLTADGLSEVVGSLVGRQRLRVWGLGEVNRKSVAGTWACFAGSLAVCVPLVHANGLPPSWLGLAVAVSLSNTAFELFSPRGTDDFTMATANALLCWAFGALVC